MGAKITVHQFIVYPKSEDQKLINKTYHNLNFFVSRNQIPLKSNFKLKCDQSNIHPPIIITLQATC